MGNSLIEEAKEWVRVAIIIILGIYIITTLVVEFCKTNALFCSIVMGGILSAIIVGAKRILERV